MKEEKKLEAWSNVIVSWIGRERKWEFRIHKFDVDGET